jgi:transcriptional regulator with XRE-family HTH domain
MTDDKHFIAAVNNNLITAADMLRIMKKTVGERLRHAIKRRGFSGAAEFARRIGETPEMVRAVWNGFSGLTTAKAEIYARALGVDPSWLLYGTGRGPDGKPTGGEPASNIQADFERLDPDLQQYLADQIARLSRGDKDLVVEYAAELTVTRLLNNLGAPVDSAKWYDLVASQIRAAIGGTVAEPSRATGDRPKRK